MRAAVAAALAVLMLVPLSSGIHTASHHSNLPARMETFAQINRYHVEMLAYFLDKLKTTPDGDGPLLDHSVVLYGSSMSNATSTTTIRCRSSLPAAQPAA